eukprot:4550655-Alexandrium_andersonii.AAC.1
MPNYEDREVSAKKKFKGPTSFPAPVYPREYGGFQPSARLNSDQAPFQTASFLPGHFHDEFLQRPGQAPRMTL